MTDHNDPLSTGAGLRVLGSLGTEHPDDLIGRQFGDYRIESLIAEGGMGRVYRASRSDGVFERDVAVKVLGTGRLSNELLSRFEQEQKVLAGLNHPNICQLYDASVAEEGWPYIVMELIDGESIVDYCQNRKIEPRQRLRLLIDVVDAIAFAHSQLVVHRDIKPANVMVSATGQVKLLDFGVAKLLGSDANLTQSTPLTPRYASPEQLLGQPVTIASDIAQLGLLIYEVVTGDPLNTSETFSSAIQRAAQGKPIPVELRQPASVPREVLPIIEQCVRPNPRERYPDAGSLKADLAAYLDGYPVAAVGQSTGYRLRKFLSRNLPTVLTAGMATAAIVAGVAWYTWQLSVAQQQAKRQAAAAEQQAERANQVSEFLIALFDSPKPEKSGFDVTVREVLESGISKLRTELAGQETLQAELLTTLGDVFNQLGEFGRGGELLEEALEIYDSAENSDPSQYAAALFTYGQNAMHLGDLELAADRFEKAIGILKNTAAPRSTELQAAMLNSLGIVLSRLNRFEESEIVYQESILLKVQVFGRDHVETSVPVANYGRLLAKMGRYEEALPMLESSYDIAVAELGPYHPWIAPRAINLGRTYEILGNPAEAEKLLRVALDQDREIFGETHHYMASSLQNLGLLVYRHRDPEEGVELIEQGLEIEKTALGDEHIDTNQTRTLLAGLLTELGRLEEAERLLETARAVLFEAFDGDHRYIADLLERNGQWLLAADRPQEAIGNLTDAIAMDERLFGADSDRLAKPLIYLAEAYGAAGDDSNAVDAYSRAVDRLEADGKVTSEHYARLKALKETAVSSAGNSPRRGSSR